MKKFLSILLAVVLCFSVCSVVAFAAGEDIVVKAVPSKTTLNKGDTFTVDFNITTNAGFNTLGLEVGYDDAVLEVVCPNHADGKSCTAKRSPVTNMLDESPDGVGNIGENSKTHDVNPYKIMWAFGTAEEDVVDTGRIATLTFKVKADAKLGSTAITLNVDQASSIETGAYAESKRAGVSANVTVACSSHTKDAGTVTKEATCTEKGTKTYKCKDCGAAMGTENIPAIGHAWGNWEGTADAKCGQKGKETRVCANDANHKETRDTNALEHLWDNGTVTTEPTCTADGVKTFKCTRTDCTGSKTEKIAKLGHKYGAWEVTTEPTCEDKGVETRVCANDASHKETRAVDAIGHEFDYENPVVTKEPTCTEEGEEEYECINGCGEVETGVIDALGHTVDWAITKEATLTEKGERTGVCDTCGETITEEIPMLTFVVEGDKLGIVGVDAETGEIVEKAADGFKVESGDDEPFSGYVKGEFVEAVPEGEDANTVDGKTVAIAYGIGLIDVDTEQPIDMDKVITLTIPVSKAVLGAYENLVLVGVDDEGNDVVLESATFTDGAFVVTGKYSELVMLAIAGDKIVVEEEEDNNKVEGDVENEGDTSPATGDATAIAFVVVMLAISASVLVFTSKKIRA